VVEASGTVSGVITDRDICIATATRRLLPEHIAATQAMTRPVPACLPDDSITDVLNAMKTSRIRRVPVIDDQGHLQGVISLNDIVIRSHQQPSGVRHGDRVGHGEHSRPLISRGGRLAWSRRSPPSTLISCGRDPRAPWNGSLRYT
jgi:hypothetical protein